jgi:photosystem II stability/assembly factor-like uncharacterized protein
LNANDAWVAVVNPRRPKGFPVYRTFDGGAHWARSIVVPVALTGVEPAVTFSFADSRRGLMFVTLGPGAGQNPYVLLRTVDGGANWVHVAHSGFQGSSPTAFSGCDCTQAITLRDATTGWSTGAAFAQQGLTWLYVTHDGGRRWAHQSLALLAGTQYSHTDAPFVFGRNEVLPVTVTGSANVVRLIAYWSGDGGSTWRRTTPIVLGQNPQYSASFVDPSHGWVINGSNLYRTTDGGRAWNFRRNALPVAAAQVDFVNRTLGFAVNRDPLASGARPFLLQTRDGGSTWRRLYTLSAALPLHS